jgi:hypothetical protein
MYRKKQYWIDHQWGVVCGCDTHDLDKFTPVIVIPVAQWKRLVSMYQSWMPSCPCDGNCESCEEDREIKAIIDSVEVPHD